IFKCDWSSDVCSSDLRTPVGVKVFGSDLKKIEEIGQKIESIVKNVPGTRSVYSERTAGGYFVDFDLNREAIARYGLTIGEVQDRSEERRVGKGETTRT